MKDCNIIFLLRQSPKLIWAECCKNLRNKNMKLCLNWNIKQRHMWYNFFDRNAGLNVAFNSELYAVWKYIF